jgi:type VI secretion system secreted protein VgrG
MGEYKHQDRKLRVNTPLGPDELLLTGLWGTEAISTLFSYRLDMSAENKTKVAFDAILGQKVTVYLQLPDGSETYLNGLCVRMVQGGRDEFFTAYEAEIVPDAWKLTRKAQSRIFQRMTVPEILKKVFTGINVDWQLIEKYEPRDYCVQYRETDFNFGARLMEEEGIYFYFEHSDGDHKMIASDSPSDHPDLKGENKFIFEEVEGGVRDENRVWAWKKEQEIRSGKYELWDHCFELPHKHLEAEALIMSSVPVGKETHNLKVTGVDQMVVNDWPGEYAQRFDGINKGGGEQPEELQKIFQDNRRTVGIRMDEETTPAVVIRAKSNVKHLVPGYGFTLQRHFNADGKYVVTSVKHMASCGAGYRSGDDAALAYENEFTCIPPALPYRPRRTAPKPVVQGSQSAVVVGPKGEEIFTDKYGRVKVQFHWDREGKNDENSSCWLRVGQLAAGRRWGASYWPRIGQEVIVDFLEGDPDQPIIVGTVYNADQMPPYLGQGPDGKHKNDNKLSGYKSNTTKGGVGFNELRFDDTKDKEQVFIHAEKDMDVRVKSVMRERILSDRHLVIGGEKDGKKGGDYKEKIFRDRFILVKRHHEEQVAGDMMLLVGGGDEGKGNLDTAVKGKRTTTVGGKDHLHVKEDSATKVDGGLSVSVGGGTQEKTGTNWAHEAGQEIHLKAGVKVIIEAGTQVTLKGPGGFVDIGPSGVTIQGTMVLINSGGSAGSGSGASPASPDDAKEAAPPDPAIADDAKTGQKSC